MPFLPIATALDLVASFFPFEWAHTDPKHVHLEPMKNGFMNTLQLLSRSNPAHSEPQSILIRHFGRGSEIEEPPERSLTLSATQQAIVYWEMSRRGWGPKVYGFFLGGRLEEYVDSHTLTSKESMQPDIRREVARSYARLHSLELPLRKDGFEAAMKEFCGCVQRNHERVCRAMEDVIDDSRAKPYASIFRDTDWIREIDWISALLKRYNCKTTLTHGDANYLNILIRSNQNTQISELEGCQTLLIDYETVSYSYRGFDIGGHFSERMFSYNQPDTHLTGYEVPGNEEQRLFCEDYLEELKKLGVQGSQDETVAQLTLEARIGMLGQILITNLMCTVYDDQVEAEPMILEGLVCMMETYRRAKGELVEDLCEA